MNTKTDQPETYMQFPAAAYPWQHPYRVALRRVEELTALLANCSIIDVAALTRYTARPLGGMGVDQPHGPWVALRDVMGMSRGVHPDDAAIARFATDIAANMARCRREGRGGWKTPDECSVEKLAAGLVANVWSGDLDDIAAYAMMLHHRGASKDPICEAMKHLVDCQISLHVARLDAAWETALATTQIAYAGMPDVLLALDYLVALAAFAQDSGKPIPTPPADPIECSPYGRETAETFAQALIAKGWHNDDINCVDGVDELLAAFLGQYVGEVSA